VVDRPYKSIPEEDGDVGHHNDRLSCVDRAKTYTALLMFYYYYVVVLVSSSSCASVVPLQQHRNGSSRSVPARHVVRIPRDTPNTEQMSPICFSTA